MPPGTLGAGTRLRVWARVAQDKKGQQRPCRFGGTGRIRGGKRERRVMTSDLIFDFFGTLVQYNPGPFQTAPYAQTFDYVRGHGFALSYEDFISSLQRASDELEGQARATGQEYSMDTLCRRFFRNAFDTDVAGDIAGPFVDVFLAEWGRGITPLESLHPLLSRLARDYRLSILSNTNHAPLLDSTLASLGISRYFSHVFTSIEVGVRKPFPAIFRHGLDRLGIGPADAVYIGDSYAADYQGAASVGLRCILIDPDGKFPDVAHRVDSLFGLERHL